MSIVGTNNPTGKPSVQDSLWHIAFSDNSGQTNFKYIFDIYDQGAQQLARTKIFPNPTNGRGYFDAGSVVRNLMTYDWFQPYGIVSWNPDTSGQIAIKYIVRYGEEYNIGASGITNINMASGEVTAYNFVPTLFDRGISDLTAYENKILSTRYQDARLIQGSPNVLTFKEFSIKRNQRFFLGYHSTKNIGQSISVKVSKLNANDSVISDQTFSFTLDYSQIIQLDVGTTAIGEAFGTSWLDGAAKYLVEFETQLIKFTINNCESQHPTRYLHFVNRFGVYETCEFDLVSKLTSETERKAFEKSGFEFLTNMVRVKNANNVYQETKINYSQQTNWAYRITKNYPTDLEWQWAEELIYSPKIYFQQDGYYYPVTIKTSTYERFKQIYAGLKTLEIDIEMNQKRNGFLR